VSTTIYKYPLHVADEPVVRMPKGARILSAQAQHGALCVWAVVDTDQRYEDRRFRVYGTGHPVDTPPSWAFIGTVQLTGGALVFHVFAEPSP
jgi:hypothetical protein